VAVETPSTSALSWLERPPEKPDFRDLAALGIDLGHPGERIVESSEVEGLVGGDGQGFIEGNHGSAGTPLAWTLGVGVVNKNVRIICAAMAKKRERLFHSERSSTRRM
jgi:hypothetical protein